jgi:hypothetical protein
MTSYPTPAYAATIWVAGDKIMLGFEETRCTEGHCIAVPMTDKGLAAAIKILQARAALPQGNSQVSTMAEPTQFMLDREILKYQKRTMLPEEAWDDFIANAETPT